MKIKKSLTLTACALASHVQAQSLNLISKLDLGVGSGEVVSYSGGRLAATNNPAGGVSLFNIGGDFSFNNRTDVLFSGYDFSDGDFTFGTVTSVAMDSRGFGFAAIQNGSGSIGKLGVFNAATGAILGSYNVGNGPDMVRITGNRVLVANEGEFGQRGPDPDITPWNASHDTAGSISYFSFSGATGASDVVANMSTVTNAGFSGFSDTQLASLNIRLHDNTYTADERYKNLEPEYIAVAGERAFVTLQENNAIAVINLSNGSIEGIHDLGTHIITTDANRDNGIAIDDVIKGAIMPDSIETFEANGKTYLIVGSEGDARGDDADIQRAKSFTGVDATLAGANPDGLTIDVTDTAGGIGDLNLVKDLSDPDGDGDLDDIVALSSRDVTIYEYNLATGALTEVSNIAGIEAFLAAQDPTRHNANDGGDTAEMDQRSDDKGPELEAIDVSVFGDQILAVVAAERQGGLMLFDITNPESPFLTSAYANGFDEDLISPETLQFADINGQIVVIAGFEGNDPISGGIGIYQILPTAIPEPRTYALMAGALALAFAAYRRPKRN